MITRTFAHIKGVSEKTEQKLWSLNITDWDSFLSTKDIPLSGKKAAVIKQELVSSQKALLSNDHLYFYKRLPNKLHWRLFDEYKTSTVYLDIETTGLNYSDEITTCVLYDGKNIRYYVNGQNLDDLVADLKPYKTIITYNGKCFDVPFIEKYFDVKLPQAHIDLRYVLASLGYSGGLKGCERQFGMSRSELEGVDGFFAVLLWQEYKKGKKIALDTLLAYNAEDVVNLEYLMHQAYNQKLKITSLAAIQPLEIPKKPKIHFSPDSKLIKNLKTRFYSI